MNPRPVVRIRLEMIAGTIAVASAVMGAIAMGYIMRDLGPQVLVVGACAAPLAYVAARLAAARARTPTSAVLRCLGFTVAASMLNSPLSFVAVSVLDRNGYEPVGLVEGAVAAFLFGGCITVPLGAAFAVPFMVLVGTTHRSIRDPSTEGFDRTARACGVCLAALGAVCAAAAVGLRSSLLGPGAGANSALAFAGIALSTLGAVAAVIAHARVERRRRWIERVRAGLEPGWSLVAADQVVAGLAHLRPLLTTDSAPEFVLVRRSRETGPGAYRRGEGLEPVALV